MRKKIIERDGIIYTPCFNGYAVKGSVGVTSNGIIQIPEFIDGVRVVRVAANAFNSQDWIKEVYLPCDISTIEDRAFYNCKRLKKVIFSGIDYNGVLLGRAVFYNCSELEKVGRPVRLDGPYVFQNCYNLVSVTIVGAVPIGSFWGDYKVKTVHLFPEKNEPEIYISDGSFDGCSNIKTIFFYSDKIAIHDKELNTFKNATLYCEDGCDIWDLYYDGYDVRVIL